MNFDYTYCGDEEMSQLLKKAGSHLSLSQIYGLFHGSVAATHIVEPTHYIPFIFGEEDVDYGSLEDTTDLLGSLISLWDKISGWDPEKLSFTFPDITYNDTHNGTAERLNENYTLIEYFIRGLDMGHVAETDFSKGGLEALKSLSEAGAFLYNYLEILENEESRFNIQLSIVHDSIDQLEEVTGDAIAQMNLSLKDARKREADQMQMLEEPDLNIPGDSPCTCESGKNYNRCCGLVH